MTDFVKSRRGKSVVSALPRTSYAPGAFAADLNDVLPDFVADRLRKAFPAFDRKLRGYYTSEALLLAVESRTSSPVRLPRDPQTLQHIDLQNLEASFPPPLTASVQQSVSCGATFDTPMTATAVRLVVDSSRAVPCYGTSQAHLKKSVPQLTMQVGKD